MERKRDIFYELRNNLFENKYIHEMEKWLYLFPTKTKKLKNGAANRILEEMADNILGSLKEKYCPRYFYQLLTQLKSGSFYLIIRKKRGRLT